ncbi:restriction modification enzyme [Yersinia frederiksenii]|nr:restriction modification enzyme [Yersinia frederiksenii]CNK32974.1 restriction modification enzyme [Yersinia frederiksenii]
MVPNRWDVRPLADIALITSGGTPSRTKPEFWQNGTIPWIRTTEVQNCILTPDDVQEYISEEGLKGSSAKLVPSGTVLLAMIGQGKTRGQVALLRFESTINQNCAAIIFNNDQEPYFHFNFLLSQYETIRSMSNSAGQSNLSGALVKTIKVPVPPLAEQKKIAKILSVWDKAITITEKLLANSQQQKKALMHQLLNGHTRLPGFSNRWMGGVLGDIATIDSGFAFKSNTFINTDNGIPVIRMNNLKNGRLDISDSVKISPEITKGLEKFSLLENDFLFGMSGSLNNYAWVTAKDLPCYLNQRVGRITAKNNHDQTFLTYLYLSDKVQKSILDKAEGAAQLNISINELRETPINYPAPKEQKKIAEILLSADNYITKLQQKLHYLKQEKKALMQQLLTGKRRVKVDAA